MKKGKLTLGIVLGVLIIGFVVAQAISAQDATRDRDNAEIEEFTLSSSGYFCLDLIGYCDDAKLAYQSLGDGMYALHGYEYGCGDDDALLVGTMRVVGDTLHIGYVNSWGGEGYCAWLGQYNAQIDLSPGEDRLSGPVQWAWHYDGYQCDGGYDTAKIIVCPPVSAVVSTEPCTRD